MIKKYNQYIKENLTDKLIGPTDDEVWEEFKDLEPHDLLIRSSQNGFIKGVAIAVEKLGKEKINSAFKIACMYNQLNLVEYCITNGADVHYKDDLALITSCEQGNASIVEYLLKSGANVHVEKDEPLRSAIKFENSNIVKILIDYGADVHARGNVFFNCAKGNKKILDLLNDNDYIKESILDKMLGPDKSEIMKTIKKECSKDSNKALVLAAKSGLIEGMKFALENGADPNYGWDRVIRAACYSGNLEAIKYIVECGAKITFIHRYDFDFFTPEVQSLLFNLGWRRTISGTNESLKDLLKGPTDEEFLIGIKELCKTNPNDALISAAKNNSIEGIKISLVNGAKVNDIPFYTYDDFDINIKDFLRKKGRNWFLSSSGGL